MSYFLLMLLATTAIVIAIYGVCRIVVKSEKSIRWLRGIVAFIWVMAMWPVVKQVLALPG